jgi:nucleoside-diphosphate-sugar epimerase
MTKHVIVGAGPIGTATARLLAERGEHVVIVTRSASGPDLTGVQRVRLDATDRIALSEVAAGAAVLYNCANPAYHLWASDWPPLASALLHAAEHAGAVLATVSNLYGYGAVTEPMTENTPVNPNSIKGRVRAQMWREVEAAHKAGRIRATEIRSSDYIGPNAQSPIGDRVIPRLLAGKNVRVTKRADSLHTWTYTADVARLLVAVGSDERASGRPWHVPSNTPRTQREAIDDLARVAGVKPVTVSEIPTVALKALGLVNPIVRELHEVAYQLRQPFILDSTAAQQTFGLQPTPWRDALAATIASYQPTQSHANMRSSL